MGATVYENIVTDRSMRHVVRVWLWRSDEGPSTSDDARRLHAFCVEYRRQLDALEPFEAAKFIADRMANVNAVEVTCNGLGAVVYKDWP